MYDNIGGKIKGLAKVLFILGAITTAIAAIVLLCLDDKLLPFGVLLLFFGPLFAWISSWLLYGFGELVENSSIISCEIIERNTRGGKGNSEAQSKTDYERVRKIEKLRSQGLITEEEYQQAISKGRQEV